MKSFIICFIALFSQLVFAQSKCDCSSEYDYVVKYYEKNLPGFKDNVTNANKAQYEQFKVDLKLAAQQAENKVQCFRILTYYVEFFKDNHSKINMSLPGINDKNDDDVQAFIDSELYQSRETYKLTDTDLKQYPENDIRGIYKTPGDSYKIAIVPSKTMFRDYIGVIVESKSPLWRKGQVKLEIKLTDDGRNTAFVYLKNHALRYYSAFPFKEGILGDIWFKTTRKETVNYALNLPNEFEVKKLNDSITYLRIPTFSGGQTAKINTLYKEALPIIRTSPYLIVDVRNNGGGSDSNARPLLDLIYTNPVKNDKVELYATEGNLKIWEDWYAQIEPDTINYSVDTKTWFKDEIAKMKAAKPNTYILRTEGETITIEPPKDAPKKIIILQNRNCASSCETLLFWAKQSDKTILAGENSGGFVGYGEVGNVKTPCYEFSLYCTMTRYDYERQFEVVGIPPNVYLSLNKDWVGQAVKLLTQLN